MGMFTQVRGWLNIDSIGDFNKENYRALRNKLNEVRKDYLDFAEGRACISEDTNIHLGANNSIFLFIGTELKNYDDDAEEWIKYLIARFPNAEGRIDFQYEIEDFRDQDSKSKYWLIRGGEIIEEGYCKTWCTGYGNTID
ncbi:hypothetical protein PC41400_15025 [Paenibacillus chitinolyticus]|uniref:Uncharacterized protein n=1 Tax=Paenibacillus chitinolyticus TaxID=79263 RepID=A0A410WWX9_9BACL|nr:hypothetical protein [Paenibacillus chitinolyticus]MCY9592344.1 hypothetical protein [Paenibacillus chitinolyticus]MCY9599806.1 hypothetical protein [Paenibacillus chitinolyticus]QAV18918.1 hypothetical protein PC41400_15025 [Paenibacillus chitinolyticus]